MDARRGITPRPPRRPAGGAGRHLGVPSVPLAQRGAYRHPEPEGRRHSRCAGTLPRGPWGVSPPPTLRRSDTERKTAKTTKRPTKFHTKMHPSQGTGPRDYISSRCFCKPGSRVSGCGLKIDDVVFRGGILFVRSGKGMSVPAKLSWSQRPR